MSNHYTQTYKKRSGLQKRTAWDGSRPKEKTRLFQLLVCLILFLFVFLGRGIFPAKLAVVGTQLMNVMTIDTDFYGAFSALGRSLEGEGSWLTGVEDFCMQVFGPSEPSNVPAQPESYGQEVQVEGVLEQERAFLYSSSGGGELREHFLRWNAVEMPEREETEVVQPTVLEPEAVPAVGTVLMVSDYSGKPLPEKYTMDHISLGKLETVCPVQGNLNSGYGYRDHPINGEYQFHGGLDIGGQSGDPIQAFAAGTVDYVGEDESYGLYLQLDHGNGVKSFYAHCSSICVKKGQSVGLGETIARVGSSGSATGPHLHFELKYNSVHLDPSYYIQTGVSQ